MRDLSGLDFYTKTVDTLINFMPHLSNSELKIALMISKLTVAANVKVAEISLDEFERLTGLSRKTIIEAISRLVMYGLIYKEENKLPHRYGLNRLLIFKMSITNTESNKISTGVINKLQLIEKLHLNSEGITPDVKKVIDKWNKYFYKRLEITNKRHLKCVQEALQVIPVEKQLTVIERCVLSGDLSKNEITDEDIEYFFHLNND